MTVQKIFQKTTKLKKAVLLIFKQKMLIRLIKRTREQEDLQQKKEVIFYLSKQIKNQIEHRKQAKILEKIIKFLNFYL